MKNRRTSFTVPLSQSLRLGQRDAHATLRDGLWDTRRRQRLLRFLCCTYGGTDSGTAAGHASRQSVPQVPIGWDRVGQWRNETVNAAIYARVSTKAGSQNPDMQLRELREYCIRRGWDVAVEYVEAGVCGAKEERPQLDRLLGECRKRRVDAVVVYRYDWFARSLRQLVNAVEKFRALGIDFVSLHEGVDTSTPNGRLVFGIFASIAEFKRELVRERVRSGLAAARARGKRTGQPRKDVDAAKALRLPNSGASWRAIADRLGVSVGTAYNVGRSRSKNVSPANSASS